MLQIAYDITSLTASPHGGIAQVCLNTIKQAQNHPDIDATAYFRDGDASYAKFDKTPVRKCGVFSGVIGPRYDIAHSLCHRTLKVIADWNIYTVHDVWSLYPNRYQSPGFQKKVGERLKRDILKADFIVTVSEATRKSLLSLDLIPAEKCAAVRLGCETGTDAELSTDPAVLNLTGKKYVLYVGCLEARKNIGHVIDAVAPLSNVDLVLVGNPGFGYSDQIKPKLNSFPRQRLHLIEQADRNDIITLFRHAVCAILPSWEEGFGLPIVEAMANDCPMITSNLSANAEIGGDGAVLIDPSNPGESRQHIERLVEDASYRAAVIESGKRRVALFTWEDYFENLVKIYRKVAASA